MRGARGRRSGWLFAALAAACLTTAAAAALVLVGRPARAHGQRRPSDERVVVLGDSVATGAGCECRPFGPRLAVLLSRRLHRQVRASTLAKDGLTTSDLLALLRTDRTVIRRLKEATVVTVTISANDFDESSAHESGAHESSADDSCAADGRGTACYDQGLEELKPRVAELLATVRRLTQPGTRILVTGYWNVFLDGAVAVSQGPAYQRTSDALTRRVNDTLRSAAQAAGATYVDLYRAFHGGGATDVTALLAADGDHPSDAGQERIAQVLADYLTSAPRS